MVSIDTATLDKLRSFDTPTICNLIELFDVRPARRRLHGRPHQSVLSRDAAHRRLCGHGDVPCLDAAASRRWLLEQ